MTDIKHFRGLNEENEQIFVLSEDSIADSGTTVVTLPEKYRNGGWTPVILGANTLPTGAQGARTITSVSTATIWTATYVESTGVLTITKGAGGTLTRCLITVLMVGSTKVWPA